LFPVGESLHRASILSSIHIQSATFQNPYKIFRPHLLLPKTSSAIVVQFEGALVNDLVFITLTLAFFGAAILYLRGCERLR
jgi:hypothetical protein